MLFRSDKSKKQTLFICLRVARLISSLFYLGLVALDILFEVTSFDQVFDLILQLGALIRGVPNVFMIRIVCVLISV